MISAHVSCIFEQLEERIVLDGAVDDVSSRAELFSAQALEHHSGDDNALDALSAGATDTESVHETPSFEVQTGTDYDEDGTWHWWQNDLDAATGNGYVYNVWQNGNMTFSQVQWDAALNSKGTHNGFSYSSYSFSGESGWDYETVQWDTNQNGYHYKATSAGTFTYNAEQWSNGMGYSYSSNSDHQWTYHLRQAGNEPGDTIEYRSDSTNYYDYTYTWANGYVFHDTNNSLPVANAFTVSAYGHSAISLVGWSMTDVDAGDTLASVTITSLPEHGTLKLNDTPVTANQVIISTELSKVTFVPEADWSGVTSLTYKVTDSHGASSVSEALVTIQLSACDSAPLKDINVYTAVLKHVGSMTNLNGILYFTADDGEHGTELWRSDGTPAGTVMVKDINVGTDSSEPEDLTNVSDTLYFQASDATGLSSLWKTNGTEAGTVMVKGGIVLSDLTDVNGTLYFSGYNYTTGSELWKSDGTTAGTVMVKDIWAGSYGSDLRYLTNVNGTLFFLANAGGTGGWEVWTSNGTEAGTVPIKPTVNGFTGFGGSLPENFTAVDSRLYFTAYNDKYGCELWTSDGTAAGTVMVKDIRAGSNGSGPRNLACVNGTLYFTADDGAHGYELWKSGGTTESTILVKDITPGFYWSDLQNFMPMNGILYFSKYDDATGGELWKSNGTDAETMMVKHFSSESVSMNPNHLTAANGTLYFSAAYDTTGSELWKSDGTSAGTVMVRDLRMGPDSSWPSDLTSVNGTLYFTAYEGTQYQLFKSNGTAADTVILTPFIGTEGSDPTYLTDVNGMLYFSADNGTDGRELWKSDGTEAGTTMVSNIHTGSYGSDPQYLTNMNGTLYFATSSGVPWDSDQEDGELWKSDGTATGTVMVKDIYPGGSFVHWLGGNYFYVQNHSSPKDLTAVNGTMYFSAEDGVHGRELWKSDGSDAGTFLVKDIVSGSGTGSPQYLTNSNGTLYFSANDGINGAELWKSDGTEAGTVMVKDVLGGALGSDPDHLIDVNGVLYFVAGDGLAGRELWKSDGTALGTVMVKDIKPGEAGSSLSDFTNVNGTLYFIADDGSHGLELWKSDGTAPGTLMVKDIFSGSSGSVPCDLTNVNGVLYLVADDGINGRELWKSDGTTSGTEMVRDIVPGPNSGEPTYFPTSLTNLNDTLYFVADDGINGRELWKSDGTAPGTVMVKDFWPGLSDNGYPSSGYPQHLTPVNGKLYFSAYDPVHGNELWVFS